MPSLPYLCHCRRVAARPHSIFVCALPPHASPLFPYTTLFRSTVRRRDDHHHPRLLPADALLAGDGRRRRSRPHRSEEHTSELQSRGHLVCRLLLEKKKLAQRELWFCITPEDQRGKSSIWHIQA